MTTEEPKKTVKEFKEEQTKDTSWKEEPWIDPKDGFEYRKNRIDNGDGTFSFVNVRIGKEPLVQPKEGK